MQDKMSTPSPACISDPGRLPLLLGTGRKGGPTSAVRAEDEVTGRGEPGERIAQVPGPLSRVRSYWVGAGRLARLTLAVGFPAGEASQ